jgi:hypothetical protein
MTKRIGVGFFSSSVLNSFSNLVIVNSNSLTSSLNETRLFDFYSTDARPELSFSCELWSAIPSLNAGFFLLLGKLKTSAS